MRSRAAPLPGTWLAIGAVAAGLLAAAAMRGSRVPLDGGRSTPWPDMRVDVNAAGPAELALLPGVGPTLAQRIADDRAAAGPFHGVDDLVRVDGIGPGLLERVRPFAVAGAAEP